MKPIKLSDLIHPSAWPVWIGLSILWLITRLPPNWQIRIGKGLGKLIYLTAPKLKHISKINIQLCFPEKTLAEQTQLLRDNFASLGIGIIETAMAWWMSDKRLQQCKVTVNGLEHAEAAFAKGNGIILLGPHFTCLEMVGRLLGSRYAFAVLYRPHKKKLLAHIQAYSRKKYGIRQIARHEIRYLLRTLKENTAVWYAYDIDAGEKKSVFAPFFGIQTASLNAVSRLVTMSNATILPISFHRLDNTWGYEINLLPAIDNIPSDDLTNDATRLNASIEAAIRNKPEQYIWQYKRFKTRPIGEKRFY
jgi:KDO2-lipid IV(A) lauroyltransferase